MEMYNPAIKKRFLENYEEGSQHAIKRVFKHSKSAEELLEKDLYDFNEWQIGKVLKSLSPHNVEVSKSLGFYISSYISWAIENGLRENNINPLKGLTDAYYEKFVNKSKKIHWSESEFVDLLKRLDNYQDQALLVLLFNGVMGEDFVEIKNLKYEDLNVEENSIYIQSLDKNIKLFDVQHMEILIKAHNEKNYIVYSEEGDYKEYELIDAPYIIKNLLSKKIQTPQPVSTPIIYNRIARLRKELDLDYLSANSIKQSGMIKFAVDLWKKYGELEKEQFNIIGERFNLKKMKSHGYEYYNRSAIKKYVNEQNIKRLYNMDVIID